MMIDDCEMANGGVRGGSYEKSVLVLATGCASMRGGTLAHEPMLGDAFQNRWPGQIAE